MITYVYLQTRKSENSSINMKEKKKIENAQLGALVVLGVLFLVFTLYMIGKNQNIFGASFTITTVVENVNGLVPGNNVRYKGMDVGTVKSVEMASDSTINVTMYIKNKMRGFIKKNALTSISTDGLMGNKIVQIMPQPGFAEIVEEGDIIFSQKPIDTEFMLNKLSSSSDYFEKTTQNLFEITSKLNKSETLWALLSDTLIVDDIKGAIHELRTAGIRASAMAQAGKDLMVSLDEGEGLVNRLFTDSAMVNEFTVSLEKVRESSQHAALIIEDVQAIVDKLESGEGTVGMLLNDSLFRETLMKSMINLEHSTDNFNQNMEALKSNFLFRRYFRRLEREQRKQEENLDSN